MKKRVDCRIDSELLEKLDEWVDNQPAKTTRTGAVEGALELLLKVHSLKRGPFNLMHDEEFIMNGQGKYGYHCSSGEQVLRCPVCGTDVFYEEGWPRRHVCPHCFSR